MLEKNQEAHGDQDTVNMIMSLIDRIEENLDMSYALEREAESNRENDYAELSGRINDQINYVSGQLLDLGSQIYTLTERVNAAAEKIAIAEENEVMW